MKVSYLGTTVLLFDDGENQILFDAHVSRPPLMRAMFGKLKTDERVVKHIVEKFNITRLKAIFVSHSHYDHVLDVATFSKLCNADVYGSSSTLNVARGGGVEEGKLHLFSVNQTFQVANYSITVIPSLHSKSTWINNDLGKKIEKPLVQPSSKRQFKEGGSFDFLVENGGKKYLIRPSYNYIPSQLDGISADCLFMGIAGITKSTREERKTFFAETVDKVSPKVVIPIHWDNFFAPLFMPPKKSSIFLEKPQDSMFEVGEHCRERGISFIVQQPATSIDLF